MIVRHRESVLKYLQEVVLAGPDDLIFIDVVRMEDVVQISCSIPLMETLGSWI